VSNTGHEAGHLPVTVVSGQSNTGARVMGAPRRAGAGREARWKKQRNSQEKRESVGSIDFFKRLASESRGNILFHRIPPLHSLSTKHSLSSWVLRAGGPPAVTIVPLTLHRGSVSRVGPVWTVLWLADLYFLFLFNRLIYIFFFFFFFDWPIYIFKHPHCPLKYQIVGRSVVSHRCSVNKQILALICFASWSQDFCETLKSHGYVLIYFFTKKRIKRFCGVSSC
jgi:hypothetical protein